MIEFLMLLYFGNETAAMCYALYVTVMIGVLIAFVVPTARLESNNKHKGEMQIARIDYYAAKIELEDDLRSVGVTIKGNTFVFEPLDNISHYSALEIQEQRELLVSKYINIMREESIRVS